MKRFLTIQVEYACSSFSRQIRSYTSVVTTKTIPNSRSKWPGQSPYSDPFWDKNGAQSTPFGAAHTYTGSYKGVPLPPRLQGVKSWYFIKGDVCQEVYINSNSESLWVLHQYLGISEPLRVWNPEPVYDKKKTKVHSLMTTLSILLPCVGQRYTGSCFNAIYWPAIAE